MPGIGLAGQACLPGHLLTQERALFLPLAGLTTVESETVRRAEEQCKLVGRTGQQVQQDRLCRGVAIAVFDLVGDL